MKKILEGSRAIAETIRRIGPAVISAYPITPQTHIVEDLAKFKADGADYEYLLAESEFSAASIIQGASLRGVRVYSATCSQGLLLMTEVLYNIAGMRLPIVMTVANRAVSAPLNIWNDQQDSMVVRDAGWIMLYAETIEEACDLHIQAYKIAESCGLPAMINVDGFILTHTFEPVDILDERKIKKYLGPFKPKARLDPAEPQSLGCFAMPSDYMQIRQELHEMLIGAKKQIKKANQEFKKIFKRGGEPFIETYNLSKAKIVLVTMGSIIGTIKEVCDEMKNIGIVKIKCFRPFPNEEMRRVLKNKKYIAVVEKCISLGSEGILAADMRRINPQGLVNSFIIGLGGRDVTRKNIKEIIKKAIKWQPKATFIY